MFDFLCEVAKDEAFDLGVAGLFWGLSLALPFRRMDTRPEILWDVIGVITVGVFAYIVSIALEPATEWLMNVPGLASWYVMLESWHWSVVVIAYIVLSDLGAYWTHRALHTRSLWAQHAWHHSCKHLYWASGLRGSLIDTLMLFLPYSLAYVVFPRTEAGLVGLALVTLSIANQHYIHSNIETPFSRLVERVFVTSRYHFVHHSARKERGNSNYGFLFTGWDRLFGTYTDPDTVPDGDPLGLDQPATNWRMLIGLPLLPLRSGRRSGM
jgi:sterol desaturase/sphingolipid hydroxylase (fatty acid hydroxylase superfamily)